MDHRQIARMLAAGRVAVGVLLAALPATTTAPLMGAVARDPAVKALTRAVGVRDLALGLGTMRALDGPSGGSAARWVRLGALCDAVDGAAIVVAIRRLGPRSALAALVAGKAAAVGALVSEGIG